MLENIQHDLDNHRDTIVDHGYTSVRDRSFFYEVGGEGAGEIGEAVTQKKKGLKGVHPPKKNRGKGGSREIF